MSYVSRLLEGVNLEKLINRDKIEVDETKVCSNGGNYCHSHRSRVRLLIHDVHCWIARCEYADGIGNFYERYIKGSH